MFFAPPYITKTHIYTEGELYATYPPLRAFN